MSRLAFVFLSDDDGHRDLDVAFKLRSIQGHVSIAYARNDRPDQVGSGAASFGFPVCHATVTTRLGDTTRCLAGSSSFGPATTPATVARSRSTRSSSSVT